MPSERETADQLLDFRRIVANTVGELRSTEIRDTYAALGLEELMDQHIGRLTGSDDPLRPSRLLRLTRIRDEFRNNLEALKATSPESFRRKNPSTDVNTAVE